MLQLQQVQQARAAITPTLSPTSLVLDHVLSSRLERRVWLKGELFQRTGSFKSRGALNWLRTASPGELAGGLGAVSAGNHALGLAWAAQAVGVAVTIVMPENASPFKVEGTRRLGAEVILHGDINDAWALMHRLVEERGLTLAHPYDDERIIVGEFTYPLCRAGVTSLAQVNEAAIHRAIQHLLYNTKLMAEPGAAVGVACLLEDAVALPPSGDIVVVITGGNLGREELKDFL